MKQTNVFSSILMHFKHPSVGGCLTIFRTVLAVVLSASFLTACSPGGTTNNYGGTQAGMSGGGATKDPGDGTGGATGDGGGGQGVRCGEFKNSKISNRLFVRDLYEATNNHNLQMRSIPNDVAGTDNVSSEAIAVLTKSIRAYYGPASSKLDFAKDSFWKDFIQRISFLDEDRELFPSQDANSPIALPKECKIVQIAYWDESSGKSEEGTLYVSKKLWSELDQTNKIGLLAHELFFKLARRAQYKNSDSIRSKVGQLLSTNGIPTIFKSWDSNLDPRLKNYLPKSKRGFKICEGSSTEDSTAKILLYQYQGTDKLQHLVIPMLQSTSVNANPFQTSNFVFDPTTSTEINAATDLLLYQSMLLPPETRGWSFAELPVWIDRWFDRSGLLSKKLNSNSNEGFNRLSKELYYKKQVLWMDYLTPAPKSLKISLLNSFFNQNAGSQKSLKSREEIISIVNKRLTKELSKCMVRDQRHLVDAAIASLHSEITESQKIGKYPEEFPLWTSSLEQITTAYDKKKRVKIPNTCDLLDDVDVASAIPTLLYKIYLSNNTPKETERILGDEVLTADAAPYKGYGRIRASQDGVNVDFDLNCKDYGMQLAELNRPQEASSAQSAVSNKEVTFIPYVDPEDDEPKDEEPNSPQSVKRRNAKEKARMETQAIFEHLTNSLSFKNSANIDGELAYLAESHNSEVQGSFMAIKESQMKFFVASLKQEKKLTVEECEKDYFPETPELLTSSCAIITMKTQNLKFQIYFVDDFEKMPMLQITFVKVVPPAQTSEPEVINTKAPLINHGEWQ